MLQKAAKCLNGTTLLRPLITDLIAPHLFQEGDREKFGNFVAALSPRQMVHNNLAEALHAWSDWVTDEGG